MRLASSRDASTGRYARRHGRSWRTEAPADRDAPDDRAPDRPGAHRYDRAVRDAAQGATPALGARRRDHLPLKTRQRGGARVVRRLRPTTQTLARSAAHARSAPRSDPPPRRPARPASRPQRDPRAPRRARREHDRPPAREVRRPTRPRIPARLRPTAASAAPEDLISADRGV